MYGQFSVKSYVFSFSVLVLRDNKWTKKIAPSEMERILRTF